MLKNKIILLLTLFMAVTPAFSQYIDTFDSDTIDPGWEAYTGDGDADIQFVPGDGYGVILVDATLDQLGIWWAVIKHRVTGIDYKELAKPNRELRVEARIKVSHAPRRVNLSFNHTSTTDYHSHLKEYDIPDTTNWHVISMTTQDFTFGPTDSINVQLALMDWGLQRYRIDVDYIKVDVAPRGEHVHDLGNPQTYHPPVPDLVSFGQTALIGRDALIDPSFPDRNFYDWSDALAPDAGRLLPVSHDQIVIMKPDLTAWAGKSADGLAVLEMHLHHLERAPQYSKDFGMVHLSEIRGGDRDWEPETVTCQSFLAGGQLDGVINGQMIIDVDMTQFEGGSVLFAIPQAVMQRLLDGSTRGLALRPLGAVHASFYASTCPDEGLRPRLYLNIK